MTRRANRATEGILGPLQRSRVDRRLRRHHPGARHPQHPGVRVDPHRRGDRLHRPRTTARSTMFVSITYGPAVHRLRVTCAEAHASNGGYPCPTGRPASPSTYEDEQTATWSASHPSTRSLRRSRSTPRRSTRSRQTHIGVDLHATDDHVLADRARDRRRRREAHDRLRCAGKRFNITLQETDDGDRLVVQLHRRARTASSPAPRPARPPSRAPRGHLLRLQPGRHCRPEDRRHAGNTVTTPTRRELR